MVKYESLHEALKDYTSEADVEKIADLQDAILDGHVIPSLGDLTFLKECTQLGYLSLNKCDLRKLETFPSGLAIERLELCDNKLHDGLEALHSLEKLEELHLGGNKFDTLSQLQPLAKLANLRILDITDCPITEKEATLHEKIFKLLPTLEAFNGKDASGESVDFEDGSSDLDDYSDEEDSEEDSDGSGSDEDDSEGSVDEDGDEGEEEEGDEANDGPAKPAKSARHE